MVAYIPADSNSMSVAQCEAIEQWEENDILPLMPMALSAFGRYGYCFERTTRFDFMLGLLQAYRRYWGRVHLKGIKSY